MFVVPGIYVSQTRQLSWDCQMKILSFKMIPEHLSLYGCLYHFLVHLLHEPECLLLLTGLC